MQCSCYYKSALSGLPGTSFINTTNENGDLIITGNILTHFNSSDNYQSSHPQSVLPNFLASLNETLSLELLQLESPRQDFE